MQNISRVFRTILWFYCIIDIIPDNMRYILAWTRMIPISSYVNSQLVAYIIIISSSTLP